MPKEFVDIRCPYCKRLLFKYRVVPSKTQALLLQEDVNPIQIKCERCKSILEPRIAEEYRKVVT